MPKSGRRGNPLCGTTFVMPDDETSANEPEATEAAPAAPSVATDRLAVVAATAAVSAAIGGALLELCYTLFRF